MTDLIVNRFITLLSDELEERFIRSSGPGGQNVNKVASAVQLRFDVLNSASLTETVRAALLNLASITREGVLVITAQRFREQEKNRSDARDRLAGIIRRAAQPKRPRRPTKIPGASRKKRLDDKKRRADTKRNRSGLD